MTDTSYPVYSLLSDKDELPSSEQLLPSSMSPHPRRACSRNAIFWTTALNIVFLTAGVLFFLEGVRLQRNVESEFISRVTSFCEFYCIFCNNNRTNKSIILAPASGVISYYPRLFNLSSEEAMHYQGHPTPEITAAWDRITDDGIRSIVSYNSYTYASRAQCVP